jgi:poly(A) polymerase
MQEGWLKLIGSPNDRLPEDPIRILRAVRFSTKIGLTMKSDLLNGLTEYKDELKFTPLPRRREEWLKLVRLKSNSEAFIKLEDLGILETCLPTLMKILKTTDKKREFYKCLNTSPHHFRLSLEPAELFGIITWSLIKALHIDLSEESLIEWIKTDDVQEFFKTELGTFKVEVTQIEQALRLLPQLLNFEEFLKKGVRRQDGLISQKSFPLALTMHSLDPQNININDWINVYEKWL